MRTPPGTTTKRLARFPLRFRFPILVLPFAVASALGIAPVSAPAQPGTISGKANQNLYVQGRVASQYMWIEWWALDSSPPGTPPTIVLQPTSNPQQTVLDVTIHGFWYETVVRQGQQFRRISIDRNRDEAAYRMVGRPELPALHHLIGDLVGTQVGLPAVQIIDQVAIPGALIYPYQPPHPDDQPPPPFQWDQAFYQMMSQPYPAAMGAPRGYRGRWSGLGIVAAETYPFRVIPATQTLLVARRFMASIPHGGSNPPMPIGISRRQARQYTGVLANGPVITPYRPANVFRLYADFLIITAPEFEEEIEPLAEQKRRRGYVVSVVTTDETGATCDAIKSYIADWWAAGDGSSDHYVLLVGDTNTVPTCTSPEVQAHWSDLTYACIDGLGEDGLPDPFPEVRIGRFSCDTEAECTDMVTKTLEYEAGYLFAGTWLDDVLLTCHDVADAVYPDQYMDAQEDVRTYPYTDPPVFSTLYGQDDATNAQVVTSLEAGKGLLCYRGHGSISSWSDWNLDGQSFTSFDLAGLSNGEKTPVVFAIACLNNDITTGDCLGESWMETTERAVAHFGATGCSSRDANDLLDLELFETIYEDGNTLLSEAIAGANVATMISYPVEGESNAWQYLLLGDPELKVWTDAPKVIVSVIDPQTVPQGASFLNVTVNLNGLVSSPVPFAIVAVYKDGELADNRYTDANGNAQIPIDPMSDGVIEVTVYTEFGSEGIARDTVMVDSRTSVGGLTPTAFPLALDPARPNPASEATAFSYALPREGLVRLSIIDPQGRRVASLVNRLEGAGPHSIVWDGSDGSGRRVGAGVYFARLEFGRESRTSKIVRLR